DDLAEPALEERLDEALEARQHPRMMEPDPEPERVEDRLIEGGVAEPRALSERLVDGRVDLALLLARQQAAAVAEHVLQRALAPDPAEDEVDGGQPAASLERLDEHLGRDDPARVPPASIVLTARLVPHHPRPAAAHPLVGMNLSREVGDGV